MSDSYTLSRERIEEMMQLLLDNDTDTVIDLLEDILHEMSQ